MSPPLTPADLEQFRRIAREEAQRAAREEASRVAAPLAKRLGDHSGEMRAVRADTRREQSDSQHDIEDRVMGFERMMMGVVGRIETKVDTVAASIPPAALASKGAELAAVAGAQASVRAEGKTEAVQVAADRADKQSLAASVKANRALIAIIVTAVIQGGWNAYQAIAHPAPAATQEATKP